MDSGVLTDTDIKELISYEWISAENKIEESQIDSDVFDLRISDVGWRIPVSFRTGKNQSIADLIEKNSWGRIDLSERKLLDLNCKYIIKLQESLNFAETKDRPELIGLFAKGSNKSSFGRIDVHTKLVSDSGYDIINKGFSGDLYVEITPRSFPILVKAGDVVNQMRFILRNPRLSDYDINLRWPIHKFIYDKDGKPIKLEKGMLEDGLLLHLNLEDDIVAYRAKKGVHEPIDISKKHHYDIEEYWESILKKDCSLRLHENEFYIASTREVLVLDNMHTGDLTEYNLERAGQLRAQYARMINSGFRGQLTLEIIPHDSIELQGDQPICKVLLYNCRKPPAKMYGEASHYQEQIGPQLSKFFKKTC